MNLHVKQFTVRYQGKNCGPGSIIYDVEKDLAEKLIADSNGTIEALPEREATTSNAATSTTDTDTNTGESAATLPSVDPKKTVK